MTDRAKLIEELRRYPNRTGAAHRAAAQIEADGRLEAENERLRKAMQLVADECNSLAKCEDVGRPDQRAYKALANIARAAISPTPQPAPTEPDDAIVGKPVETEK